MNIQETKIILPTQLKETYTNDVKRLIDFFFELKLDEYSVNVTIHRYINQDGIATVEGEYTFEDVLAETKKVVNAYAEFMDSIY